MNGIIKMHSIKLKKIDIIIAYNIRSLGRRAKLRLYYGYLKTTLNFI